MSVGIANIKEGLYRLKELLLYAEIIVIPLTRYSSPGKDILQDQCTSGL